MGISHRSGIGLYGSLLSVLGLSTLFATAITGRELPEHSLMPAPSEISFRDGHLRLDRPVAISLDGHAEPRIEAALARASTRLGSRTGLDVDEGLEADGPRIAFRVWTGGPTAPVQQAIEDESYELRVEPGAITLDAPTRYGILRGIETLFQLVEEGEDGWRIPFVHVTDAPRFPWRGLMIDVARHFIPLDVLKRNVDAMAAVKLNVLHLHLSDDQGFRVESRRFPRLHELGSNGLFYSQEQVRELVAYAAARGVRIVPEFDMPGHATSWFVGHPELAARPGPFELPDRWSVREASAMDPTRGEVYEFLDAFFEEMTALFPDPFFHTGGDELNRRAWRDEAHVRAFMRARGYRDTRSLQGYFEGRVRDLLAGHGRRMIGWDEVLRPELAPDVLLQSWRGHTALAEAAGGGRQAILSFGYYLDHMRPASFHYGVDPLADPAGRLDEAARRRILGGEACMWTEFVNGDNLDARLWPRTAAIAERLWSPAELTDVEDMYRRLDATAVRLEAFGLTHRTTYPERLERLAYGHSPDPLRTLADVLEPVKLYQRHQDRSYTPQTPLDRLVDVVPPESEVARTFAATVDELMTAVGSDPEETGQWLELARYLVDWRDQYDEMLMLTDAAPGLREVRPLSERLRDLAIAGLEAIDALARGTAVPSDLRVRHAEILRAAQAPSAEMVISVTPAIERLVEASHRASAADR